MKTILKFILLLLLSAALLSAQTNSITGTIKGKLIDKDTRTPLIAANIMILNSVKGTSTDLEGNFELANLPVGSYTIKFSYIGYEPVTRTDVIVRPERITFQEVELVSTSLQTDSIVVTGGYFSDSEIQPNSITSFSYEEIRRAPGSGGDVSRILMSLPGIAKVNDQSNSLIVRGGSPIENSFFIDNIEIPNINHFPMVGSSGGPIGLLNVDFIRDVDFYSGGFNSQFGNRLSSIMDIKFREGNREEFETQLNLSFQAIGGIIEGPINNGKGSWFLSARKSYLDIIFESVAPGEALPNYADFQGKVTYDLGRNHKLSILNIFSMDRQTMTYEKAFKNNKNDYFDITVNMNTAGINWQYLWGKSGYSDFTISHLYWQDDRNFTDTKTRTKQNRLETLEQELRLRNSNHYKINNSHKIDFGLDAKYTFNDYNNLYSEQVNPVGEPLDELQAKRNLEFARLSGFVNYNWDIAGEFVLNPGLRVTYSDYNEQLHIAPRLSLSYKISSITSVSMTFGIYYQSVPSIFLAQNKKFSNLDDPRAEHYVLSINHLLNEDTKLTIELYDKEYSKLPMDPALPQVLTYDQSVFESSFSSHENLVSEGIAYSRGIEISLQKKLAADLYGLIAGTYFRSRYKDLNGTWRNRIYDNKFSFTIEGGYKPGKLWEFSTRWIYAGGVPYTPFDLSASKSANSGIYNQTLINGERLPDYHSLNLRIDKRFNFSSSSMVIYFSIWNAYGRKNLYAYSWNEMKNEPQEEKQWTTIPIFGLEFEF